MHLLLIRHGESYVNLDDWTEGFVDVGLTPLGKRQAQSLGQWMANNIHIDALYTSTMARALETTAYLSAATGITAFPDNRLREYGNCYGDGAPVPADMMPVDYHGYWGTAEPYRRLGPEGESWMLFRVRVAAFIEDMVSLYGNSTYGRSVVVVCHGGVIDAAFDHVFNVGPHRRVEIWTHNTGIVHWEYCPDSNREAWRLHSHGLVHHLMSGDEWLGAAPMLRGASQQSMLVGRNPTEDADS
ncbi:MAG: histidine phosphatase family protein [Anaerolineae bacterium]|nr:histidine phosphatase family protein [Anaerolineae bacterium]